MAGGVHGRGVHGGGHPWQGDAWQGACMVGAWQRWGHAWQRGVCGRRRVWQILRDTVNERAIHILLECILVSDILCKLNIIKTVF